MVNVRIGNVEFAHGLTNPDANNVVVSLAQNVQQPSPPAQLLFFVLPSVVPVCDTTSKYERVEGLLLKNLNKPASILKRLGNWELQ